MFVSYSIFSLSLSLSSSDFKILDDLIYLKLGVKGTDNFTEADIICFFYFSLLLPKLPNYYLIDYVKTFPPFQLFSVSDGILNSINASSYSSSFSFLIFFKSKSLSLFSLTTVPSYSIVNSEKET